jgi:hypothetical protein
VLFELMSAGCDLRIDLALGSQSQHLYLPFLEMVRLIPVVVADPPEPEPPPVEEPDPPPEPVVEPAAGEPVTFSVDGPAEPEVGAGQGGPTNEVLALLADAGGELSDGEGVHGKIAGLTGLSNIQVSNALFRLKSKGLVMAKTDGRRTSSVTLTLSGWEAAGQHGPVEVSQDRLRDRASGGGRS